MNKMIKARMRYALRRLKSNVRNGDGFVAPVYRWMAGIWNPVWPTWRHEVDRKRPFPDNERIVPVATNVGGGWDLYWGVVGSHSTITPLAEVLGDGDWERYHIDWPFLFPCASESDFERVGFVID